MDLDGPCHLLILKPTLNTAHSKHISEKHPQLLLKAKDVASTLLNERGKKIPVVLNLMGAFVGQMGTPRPGGGEAVGRWLGLGGGRAFCLLCLQGPWELG